MAWIDLTARDGSKVSINTDNVTFIGDPSYFDDTEGGCYVAFNSNSEDILHVKERRGQVLLRISRADDEEDF